MPKIYVFEKGENKLKTTFFLVHYLYFINKKDAISRLTFIETQKSK